MWNPCNLCDIAIPVFYSKQKAEPCKMEVFLLWFHTTETTFTSDEPHGKNEYEVVLAIQSNSFPIKGRWF